MNKGKWLAVLGISLLALAISLSFFNEPTNEVRHTFGEIDPIIENRLPVYRFGVLPIYNPVQAAEIYEPLTNLINSYNPGFDLKFESASNSMGHEAKIVGREFDFAIVNPYQAIVAEKYGYRIFAKVIDDRRYSGIILTRRNEAVKKPSQLKGKTISFASPTALAGTMMVRMYLKNNGVDVARDMTSEFVRSSDSAILRVYSGATFAAGTSQMGWERLLRSRPQLEKDLVISWRTPSLPHLALIVSDRVPKEHSDAVVKFLKDVSMQSAAEGFLKGMFIEGFDEASPTTYNSVRRFLAQYKNVFGELPSLERVEREIR